MHFFESYGKGDSRPKKHNDFRSLVILKMKTKQRLALALAFRKGSIADDLIGKIATHISDDVCIEKIAAFELMEWEHLNQCFKNQLEKKRKRTDHEKLGQSKKRKCPTD